MKLNKKKKQGNSATNQEPPVQPMGKTQKIL
jgi:hypothetical protein